jgi:hypothetical protein
MRITEEEIVTSALDTQGRFDTLIYSESTPGIWPSGDRVGTWLPDTMKD